MPEGVFQLTGSDAAPNGAWCWFQDERAIIDQSNRDDPLLLAGSVTHTEKGDSRHGDVTILWRRLNSGKQGVFELADQFEADDHNDPALWIRPDGRYLAMYSRHGSDPYTRWRISTNPGDPTAWGPEKTLKVLEGGVTYNNVHYLPNDNGGKGRLYNFSRTVKRNPNVYVSDDFGTTWRRAGFLLNSNTAYLRYNSDGQAIHFTSTETHPRLFLNNIYHGFIRDGQLFKSTGELVDENIFDFEAKKPADLTRLFRSGSHFNGEVMTRAWNMDTEIDGEGRPVVITTARVNDDHYDHRFFYGRWDGLSWGVHELAKAGRFMYDRERDYTGLASIDPDDPNVVYVSTEIDPRSGSLTDHYEIYRGETANGGIDWTWTAITENSNVDNLRPIVPKWRSDKTLLLWLRGQYNTYTNWDQQVMGVVLAG
jgi:hypothetical protein